MSDEIRNLVLQLRAWSEPIASGYEVPAAARTLHAAADALEAMAGERDRTRDDYEAMKAHNKELFGKLSAAELERDRLKDRLDCIDRDVAIGIGTVEAVKRLTAERDRLAGEVERLTELAYGIGSATIPAWSASKKHAELLNKMLGEAEAERDRLKAALDIAKAHAKQNQRARDLVSPYPNDHAKRIVWEKTLYHEGKDLWDKLRKALGGDE